MQRHQRIFKTLLPTLILAFELAVAYKQTEILIKSKFTQAATQTVYKEPRFQFDILTSASGNKKLGVAFLSISDIHWGSRASRAKRLCHMLEHMHSPVVKLVGDIIDGQALVKKQNWNIGTYHREGLAHILRWAGEGVDVTWFKGNHEHGLEETGAIVKYDPVTGRETITEIDDPNHKPHRFLTGKTIYGVKLLEEEIVKVIVDGVIRRMRIEHSHRRDDCIYKDRQQQSYWEEKGNYLNDIGFDFDEILREELQNEDASIVAHAKKIAKSFINGRMGVRRAMMQALDDDLDIDCMLYGHSHMSGFEWTDRPNEDFVRNVEDALAKLEAGESEEEIPFHVIKRYLEEIEKQGKLLINDGSCTDHVECYAIDKNGTEAFLTWHKDHVYVRQKDGQSHRLYWKKTPQNPNSKNKGFDPADPSHFFIKGMEHLDDGPTMFKDEYTSKADRLLRVIYRQYPPRDRMEALKDLRAKQKDTTLTQDEIDKAEHAFRDQFGKLPIPRTHEIYTKKLPSQTPLPL
jgi:hypothetical protein